MATEYAERIWREPLTLSLAALLLTLLSLWNLAAPVVSQDKAPMLVVVVAVLAGFVGLLAVWGIWTGKRWAFWLAAIVSVVRGLDAAPGIAFAPTTLLQISATAVVITPGLIIAQVWQHSSQLALQQTAPEISR